MHKFLVMKCMFCEYCQLCSLMLFTDCCIDVLLIVMLQRVLSKLKSILICVMTQIYVFKMERDLRTAVRKFTLERPR